MGNEHFNIRALEFDLDVEDFAPDPELEEFSQHIMNHAIQDMGLLETEDGPIIFLCPKYQTAADTAVLQQKRDEIIEKLIARWNKNCEEGDNA